MAKRKVYALSEGIVIDCEGIYKDLMNVKYIKSAIGETRWRELYIYMCDFVRKAFEINNPLMLMPIDKEKDKDILEEDYDHPVQVILFDADHSKYGHTHI